MTTAYRLLLPDGWYRYPIDSDPTGSAGRFLDRHFDLRAGDDRDAVMARRRARSDTARAFDTMASSGAVDLYFFDGAFGGVTMSMLFTVGVVYLGPGSAEIDLAQLAPALGDEAVVVGLPVGSALRSRQDAAVDTGAALPDTIPTDVAAVFLAHTADETTTLRTRVEYLIPVPGDPGSFALVSFRSLGAPFADERVEHFDILITGFSWNEAR